MERLGLSIKTFTFFGECGIMSVLQTSYRKVSHERV